MNATEFGKRLKEVIEYYSLSASAFAELINVQRSSISHVLSGRNKPSLDFITKLNIALPDVNLYWLLNGSGEMTLNPYSSVTDKSDKIFENRKVLFDNIPNIIQTSKNIYENKTNNQSS